MLASLESLAIIFPIIAAVARAMLITAGAIAAVTTAVAVGAIAVIVIVVIEERGR